jgi:hypothetical protein
MCAQRKIDRLIKIALFTIIVSLASCAANVKDTHHDPSMDFAAIRTVAVMPFANLTTDKMAAERVRDVFTTMLTATEAMYVLPPGEVARGISRVGVRDPSAPSPEEIQKLAGIILADAVITGVVREYGVVRSGSTSANIISLSLSMVETETGKVVWTSSSTKGGISLGDRLFGGGGEPMNEITVEAIDEILDKLFQ